jgi:hypothetical protein
MKGKIALARQHLGVVGERVDKFQHEALALARISMKETEVTDYVEKFFPTNQKPDFSNGADLLDRIVKDQQDRTDAVRRLLADHYAETERIAKRNEAIMEQILANHDRDVARGTAWGAYNAVSQYVDHDKKYQSADTRLNSVWFGAGNDLKQDAYAAALAMAV